jgi:hypothetical protein
MRNDILTAMLVMAGTAQSAVKPSEVLCQGTSHEEVGNSYCQKVRRVTYENVGMLGKSAQYQEVTHMDQQTGECQYAPRQISGPLAPFDEPVSVMNIRSLTQKGVLTGSSCPSTSAGHST